MVLGRAPSGDDMAKGRNLIWLWVRAKVDFKGSIHQSFRAELSDRVALAVD